MVGFVYRGDLVGDRVIITRRGVNDVMRDYLGCSRKEFLTLDPVVMMNEDSAQTFNALIEDVFANQPQELSTALKIKGMHHREFRVLTHCPVFLRERPPEAGRGRGSRYCGDASWGGGAPET